MACIHTELVVELDVDAVWAAVRDFGAVHQRLVPGVLTDCTAEPAARTVTFANGLVLRELLVDIDDGRRRLAYAAVGGRTTHHNASIQVLEAGPGRSRIVWVTDFLPAEMTPAIAGLVELGANAMKATLALAPPAGQ